MKHSTLIKTLPFSVLLLAGCGQDVAEGDLFDNPLYARYYYQDLANHMADYSIQNDPMLKDAEKKGVVDSMRTRALEHINNANAQINAGKRGGFMPASDYAAGGAMLHEGTLYFGPDFNTQPGPALRVYVSTMVDPRGESGSVITFPNDSSIDLGPLHSPYAAQSYVIPEDKRELPLRSVALWDTRLQRLFGFAQMYD